jgi:hypothetical protein
MAKARTMWKKNPISPAIKRRPLKKKTKINQVFKFWLSFEKQRSLILPMNLFAFFEQRLHTKKKKQFEQI